MHPDVDDLMRSRMDASAAMEGLVAGWLKRAGFWVVLSPEHSGSSPHCDMYVRTEDGKTLAHIEVKSRKLDFHSPETFPYDTIPLCTRAAYKEWRDYVIISQNTHRAIVSMRDTPRHVATQSDGRRGVAGPVWMANKGDTCTFVDYIKELSRRGDA